jgi:hypothetical protein
MTERISASAATFAATQTDATVVSEVQNLTQYVVSAVKLKPHTMLLEGSPPVDLLISELVLRSKQNPNEVREIIYQGGKVPIAKVMEIMAADVDVLWSKKRYYAEHGLEAVWKYDNGSTQFDAVFMWLMQNTLGVEEGVAAIPRIDGVPGLDLNLAQAQILIPTPPNPNADSAVCTVGNEQVTLTSTPAAASSPNGVISFSAPNTPSVYALPALALGTSGRPSAFIDPAQSIGETCVINGLTYDLWVGPAPGRGTPG